MRQTARQLQKRETRSNILQVATEQFAQRGIGVTTTEIAKAAGLAHGSVFAHFPTREALLDAVVDAFFDTLNAETHRAASGSVDIAALLRVHLSVLGHHESFYRRLVTELAALPAACRQKLFAHQSTLALHFAEVIARQGDAIVPLPGHMLFNSWIALVHYYLQHGDLFAPGESVLQRCGDALIDSYLTMIRTAPTKEAPV